MHSGERDEDLTPRRGMRPALSVLTRPVREDLGVRDNGQLRHIQRLLRGTLPVLPAELCYALHTLLLAISRTTACSMELQAAARTDACGPRRYPSLLVGQTLFTRIEGYVLYVAGCQVGSPDLIRTSATIPPPFVLTRPADLRVEDAGR